MLGDVLDKYSNRKTTVQIQESYCGNTYTVFHGESQGEQGYVNEGVTAEELYKQLFDK